MCRSGGLWLVRSSRCNDKTRDLQVVPCVESLPGEWWSGDMSRWVNDGTKYLADHGERRTENWQIHDPDESIVCLESHLKSIRLIDFEGGENEIELLRFFLKNAQILEKLTIFWGKYAFWDVHPDKPKETSEKVLKLPRTSSQVILTFLDAKPESSSCNCSKTAHVWEQVQLSNEHFTSWLISKCGFLGTLILEDCGVEGMRLLDIASTSLMSVTLVDGISNVESYGNCEIKISCPSLKFFKYSGPVPKDIVVENLFSIEVVCVNLMDRGSTEERGIMLHNMIKEVHHSISDLELCMTSISVKFSLYVKWFVPVSFYKLKSLKLEVVIHEESMQVMILLLKYSPNLEVLKLWSDENVDWYMNWQLLDLDESIVCLESHLKSIHLTGFKGDEDEIELVRFFLMNATVLEKLMIFWEGDTYKSEEASEEVLKLPRTSSHVVLTLLDAKPGPRTLNWYNRYSK
ncbi:putative ankyrin repeat-containing protein-like [Capsicum annuum]|uniref:FBD domain-containing protein n=1 Tax=Capsicum annuum TaxID=4072 RepID=A0A2G3AM92_CAPAN|nr:putative ankyrin repeat-containing protein-like [Capsicum annuum]KAF3671332.1 putative ankyrin repeat-containing protein-like [Capsicum annuum]PHT95354.1 hypothetical protein T459_03236 [Capsicum annuum]